MNERQRMQYLDAMGVDTFVPRWVLPGARTSVRCALPIAEDTQATAPRDLPVSPAPTSQQPIGSLVERLLRNPEAPQPPAQSQSTSAKKPEPAAEKAAQTETEAAAFALAFWQVSPSLMVVDSKQPKVLPTEALLSELLTAVGVNSPLPKADVQIWPMPGAKDRSWSAASETLQMFLESRLAGRPTEFLLLLGADASRALLPATEQVEYGTVAMPSLDCTAIVAPSLAELLMSPQLKSMTWKLLSPLRSRVDAP